MDKRSDVLVAVVAVGAGAVIVAVARGFRDNEVVKDVLGVRGLPTLIGLFIVVGGVYLIARRLITWRRLPGNAVPSEGRDDEPGQPASSQRAFALWGVLIAYALAMSYLGYVLSTIAAAAACLWIAGVRSPVRNGLIALGVSISLWGLFDVLLGMGLPPGLLAGLLVTRLAWL